MNNNLNYPKSIIFDWDGTIVGSEKVVFESLRKTMLDFGYKDHEIKSAYDIFSHSARDFLPKLFPNNWKEVLQRYYVYYNQMHLSEIAYKPLIIDLLDHAYSKKIPMFVVSNKNGKLLREEAQYLKLDHYFYNIVGSLDAEFDKPHIAPVKLATEEYIDNIDKNIWFIGDTITDIKCAIDNNMTAIYYHNENHPHAFIDDQNYELHIQCFSELIKILS